MTARQAPSFCQKYRFCYCINVPLLRYLFHAATHRGTSSKTPERGNQPRQDGICVRMHETKAIPLADEQTAHGGIGNGMVDRIGSGSRHRGMGYLRCP